MEFNSVEDYVMNAGSNRNAAVLSALLENEPGMKELPDSPTVNGTYNLQNSVSSGTSTLSWANGGSSGGVLVDSSSSGSTVTLSKTYKEIKDGAYTGCLLHTDESNFFIMPIYMLNESSSNYKVRVAVPAEGSGGSFDWQTLVFTTDSENGYPSASIG